MSYENFLLAKQQLEAMFKGDLWLDFEVHTNEKSILKIVASLDFSHYHNVEIILHEPKYFSGALNWTTSPNKSCLIDILDAEQHLKLLKSNTIETKTPSHSIAFLNDDQVPIIATASDISICTDIVYYYFRENLKSGERLADWVK